MIAAGVNSNTDCKSRSRGESEHETEEIESNEEQWPGKNSNKVGENTVDGVCKETPSSCEKTDVDS